jgi:hypothetical protein
MRNRSSPVLLVRVSTALDRVVEEIGKSGLGLSLSLRYFSSSEKCYYLSVEGWRSFRILAGDGGNRAPVTSASGSVWTAAIMSGQERHYQTVFVSSMPTARIAQLVRRRVHTV